MNNNEGLSKPVPILVVDLFPETLDSLVELLSGLTVEDWGHPTVCACWSVKDVALHLLGVEIGNLSSRRDKRQAGSHISEWDVLVNHINHSNQEWVEVSRRVSDQHLIELLGFVGPKVYDYYRSLDPYEIGGVVSWAGSNPQPIWLDLAREYTERWHHQQHIRDAVGKPGLKGSKYLQPVLSTFIWSFPHAFRHANAASGTSITLSVVGESGGDWTVVCTESGWVLFEGKSDSPGAKITIEDDLAWRMFTRSIELGTAKTRAVIEGDLELTKPIFEMVSIIA